MKKKDKERKRLDFKAIYSFLTVNGYHPNDVNRIIKTYEFKKPKENKEAENTMHSIC